MITVITVVSAEPSDWIDGDGQELQSAFLHRSTRCSRIVFQPLEHHFERVLRILESSEERSLEIAVERSSQLWGEAGTTHGRTRRTDRLGKNRRRNMEALRDYCDRGDFPVNDYQIGCVPIFVDRRGTACAVGHLMRKSGNEAEVQNIVEKNRFVYVPDAKDGPLIEWVLGSGFTQEEAALIQPGYGFWPPPETTQAAMISGEDLVGENLRTSGLEYLVVPSSTGELTQLATPAMSTVKGGSGQLGGFRPVTWASYRNPSHFLTFGSRTAEDGGPWLSSQDSPEVNHVFEYAFNLEITDEMALYDIGIGIGEYEYVYLGTGARVLITSIVYAEDGYVLATEEIDSDNDNLLNVDRKLLEGKGREIDLVDFVRIKTRIEFWGDVDFEALTYELKLAPKEEIEMDVQFTGAKSGVITVNSALGVYHLMRSEIPKRSASVMEWKTATGGTVEFAFEDDNATSSAYYWVEKRSRW